MPLESLGVRTKGLVVPEASSSIQVPWLLADLIEYSLIATHQLRSSSSTTKEELLKDLKERLFQSLEKGKSFNISMSLNGRVFLKSAYNTTMMINLFF